MGAPESPAASYKPSSFVNACASHECVIVMMMTTTLMKMLIDDDDDVD